MTVWYLADHLPPFPLISVALAGPRCGFVIAVLPPEGEEHHAPSARSHTGVRLAVGSVYRRSPDDETPEAWRAWMWPQAGGNVPVTQHCDAVDAPSPEKLREKLQERADKDGAWWS